MDRNKFKNWRVEKRMSLYFVLGFLTIILGYPLLCKVEGYFQKLPQRGQSDNGDDE